MHHIIYHVIYRMIYQNNLFIFYYFGNKHQHQLNPPPLPQMQSESVWKAGVKHAGERVTALGMQVNVTCQHDNQSRDNL